MLARGVLLGSEESIMYALNNRGGWIIPADSIVTGGLIPSFSTVGEFSEIAPDTNIYDYTDIGVRVKIGENSYIGNCCKIGNSCEVPNSCHLASKVEWLGGVGGDWITIPRAYDNEWVTLVLSNSVVTMEYCGRIMETSVFLEKLVSKGTFGAAAVVAQVIRALALKGWAI